jgi:glycosyltransferase involved in cell wall biosynthesis
MRLLFISTHTDQTTGYAKVAYNLLKHLPATTFHFGFQRHETFRRPKLDILQYDAAANEDPKEQGFGFTVFPDFLKLANPTHILIYNDTLIINKFLQLIPKDHPAKIYVYLDQVYKHAVLGDIPTRATKVLIFSPSWTLNLPNEAVLQHAPDESVKQLDQTLIDTFKDKFNLTNKQIFLNINRNSNRKRFDLTIQAFKLYHDRHPNSHLLIATSKEGFYNLPQLVHHEKLPTSAITVVNTPLTDDEVNLLYNIADYGINTANGEGYGLSTLEHASLGKPQIVLNLGAFRDFLNPTSHLLIQPTLRTYMAQSPFGAYEESTTPEHIAREMEDLPTLIPQPITETWSNIASTLNSILQE